MNTSLLKTLITVLFYSFFVQLSWSQDSWEGKWYAADGSNELILLVDEKMVLFEGQLWMMEGEDPLSLTIMNSEGKRTLQLKRAVDRLVLTTGDTEKVLIPKKQSDIRNRATVTSDVSGDILRSDQVVLYGKVEPNEEMPKSLAIIYDDIFSEDQKKFVTEVEPSGFFKIIYPLDIPQEVMVRAGNAFFTMISKPGARQGVVINEGSFISDNPWYTVKDIDFMGDLAVENEEKRLLNPEYMKVRGYFENDSLQKVLDPEAYQNYRSDLLEKHLAFYQTYFDSLPTSSLTQELAIRNARTYAADDMMRYTWAARDENGVGRRTVSEEYQQNLLELVDSDIRELMASNFQDVARELSMLADSETLAVIQSRLTGAFYELIENELTDPEELQLIQKLKRIQMTETDEDMSPEEIEQATEIIEPFQDRVMEVYGQISWSLLTERVESYNPFLKSVVVAIFLDQNFLTKGLEVPDEIKKQLGEMGLVPEMKVIMLAKIQEFEDLRTLTFVEGVEINESSENILSDLKKKYPDKVVYVDVWATWCGPCISEFKYLKELKSNDLEDVVFVYLCAQSPQESFELLTKKHELIGDNYFLDESQFQLFDREVQITGFPTYMIITKDGKLIREGVNRPSSGQALVNQLKFYSEK